MKLSLWDFRQRKQADASVTLKTHYCGEKSLVDEKRYCDFQGNRENSDYIDCTLISVNERAGAEHTCPAIQHIFSVCSLTEKSSSAYAGLMSKQFSSFLGGFSSMFRELSKNMHRFRCTVKLT